MWLNTSNTWLTTVYTNDDTGNRLTATDPKGNSPTKYSYADSWYSNGSLCDTGTANAFLTQTTDSLGYIRKSAYDACTGLIRQRQDPNDIAASRSGTITSYDEMNSVISTQFPDGGSTTVSYGSYAIPFTVTTTNAATPDPPTVTAAIMDGYSRTVRIVSTSDPAGPDYTDTIYDSTGRVYSVSNPYRSTSDLPMG